MNDPVAEVFGQRRRHLVGLAYRLLGSVTEAEDAVQEAWLRIQDAQTAGIEDLDAWLTVVTTRICYDALKSARVRRETYVGEWLPEPVLDDTLGMDPAERVTLDESISMAMLVVLESLSPAERTSFILHDVFKLPFDTIAHAVGRSPAACRQLAARARQHVESRAPRYDADAEEHRRAVEGFLHATTTGDLADMLAVLDPDVVLRSDGGGKVPARRAPLQSAAAVARFVLAISAARPHMVSHPRLVNGRLGLVSTEDRVLVGILAFAVADGRITEIDLVMNPDKLPDGLPVPGPATGA